MRNDICQDANTTPPVLSQVHAAALAVAEDFGNPSRTHASGPRARALLNEVRARGSAAVQGSWRGNLVRRAVPG